MESFSMMRDHKLWTIWSYILLSCSHETERIYIDNKIHYIEAGELVLCYRELSKILDINVSTLRRKISMLQKESKIELRMIHQTIICSVTKWGAYQISKATPESKLNQKRYKKDFPSFINKEEKEEGDFPPSFSSDKGIIGVINWLSSENEKENENGG